MLANLLAEGFGKAEDYNCAEKMIYGANQAYDLQLDKQACKLLAGFGGGMGVEHLCGALAGAVAVLSSLYVVDNAHGSKEIKKLTADFLQRFEQEMGALNCKPLKDAHYTVFKKCSPIMATAATILDDIVQNNKQKGRA